MANKIERALTFGFLLFYFGFLMTIAAGLTIGKMLPEVWARAWRRTYEN